MVETKTFNGLRFSKSAGPLDQLTAPPYDVLSPAERNEYAARNPHNIVHLTLPESQKEDRSQYVKYARSASLLAEWRRERVIQPESQPAYYRYIQKFRLPDYPDELVRTSVITLLKTEPYEKGAVLPHEQTFPKHKEDRLRILEATRSHLECIFGLFEDDDNNVLTTLKAAPSAESLSCTSDDGTTQILEPITDPGACEAITRALASKRIWIADGHHRYETACTFRAAQGEKEGRIPEDFLMIALASMNDPGLVLLPTHRMTTQLPLGKEASLQTLRQDFELVPVPKEKVWAELKTRCDHAQALVLAEEAYLLVPRDWNDLVDRAGEGSYDLRALDVSVLHHVILEDLLKIKGLDTLKYTRSHDEAVQSVGDGIQASFLMNPPTVGDMRAIALGGEKMPQKSTYYYPKILSGLVMWSLSDF